MALVVPGSCTYQALPRISVVPQAAIVGAPLVEIGVPEEMEQDLALDQAELGPSGARPLELRAP